MVLRRVGDVQLVGAAYHVPAGSHPDFAAVKALVDVLGDEPSGRLYKNMVETEIASSVYALVLRLRRTRHFDGIRRSSRRSNRSKRPDRH